MPAGPDRNGAVWCLHPPSAFSFRASWCVLHRQHLLSCSDRAPSSHCTFHPDTGPLPARVAPPTFSCRTTNRTATDSQSLNFLFGKVTVNATRDLSGLTRALSVVPHPHFLFPQLSSAPPVHTNRGEFKLNYETAAGAKGVLTAAINLLIILR